MPTVYDSQNRPHVLQNRLGSGGEGTVYSCADDFDLVAKIYHEPITEEKAEKLAWMAANKNERLLKVAAWVVDVLRDSPDGSVVGFLMPNVSAKEIHELYSLKSRRVYFPDATWHFLVNTAANVARAFYALHGNAHIMGDVNHGNCVVARDGTVKLIDCDSYSIKTEKRRYPCEVGVATHLAPELQGANLREVERHDKHDNFGLAVIVFQLLFLGRHPFAGNYLGGEDKSLEDCIRELRFAYGSNAALKNVRQPPGTLSLSSVSPRVALLFERAFLTEDRPEPREWIEALEDLAANLKQCALHPGHLFYTELAACPWCEIEAQTGLMLFPFITSGSHLSGEKPFNIFTVENLIASFGIENNLPATIAAPLPPAILPAPSTEILEAKFSRQKLALFVVPIHTFALIFLIMALGVGAGFYFGLLMAAFCVYLLNSHQKSAREPLKLILVDNRREFERLEKQRTGAGIPEIVADDLVKIRKKIKDYQNIQRRSVGELKLLQAKTTQRELYKFLHSKSVAHAQIPGVEKHERKILTASGVKTAAEIDENRLRHFYKIDERTIAKLLDWRAALSVDFERDERAGKAIEAEEKKFVEAVGGERRQIERGIEQLLILLRGGAVHVRQKQRELYQKSETLARRIAQAESDLRSLGGNIPAIILLILITLFVPLFGVGLSAPTPDARHNRVTSAQARQQTVSATNDYPKVDASLPDENMTDEQIQNLSEPQRAQYVESLYAEAVKYNYDSIDRPRAERYSRQAVRFVMSRAQEPRLLNQLGYALYGQKKYSQSLECLNLSLRIDLKNTETKIFISMNYLAQKKFRQSVKLMSEVTTDYPNSFEGFYSLGLAYDGLKDYVRAADAYKHAATIKPGDAGVHYHLGFDFYKLRKSSELLKEYEILQTLESSMAETLREDTNLRITITEAAPNRIGN